MKKKVFVPIIVVLISAIFATAWYFIPKTFAKGINPDDVDHFSVFDGQTGTGFQVTDPTYVKMIVRNLQNTVLRRDGISLGRMGYGFSIEGVDKNGKSIIPILFINDNSTIRKDPFFYSCGGELCFDFLRELEPDLSVEVSLPDGCVLQGTILEIADGIMIVEPLEGSKELSSCDKFSVPIEHMNASPEPEVGDRVEIIYDGAIQETYPASLGNVLRIDVVRSDAAVVEKKGDDIDCECAPEELPRLIMVDNVLYFDCAEESKVKARCGMMDGIIDTSTDGIPSKNNSSNFGTGFGYQYGPQEGTIEVLIDHHWSVFRQYEMGLNPEVGAETKLSFECAVCIDGVTYYGIGFPIPVEPDESIIEYVEIPAGHGDAIITAFARMQDGNENYLVCLIGEEWYKFIAE